MARHGINIEYSWGDYEDHLIPCGYNDAWEKMLQIVSNEIGCISEEHQDSQFTAVYCKDELKISLHYGYDNTYAYYEYLDDAAYLKKIAERNSYAGNFSCREFWTEALDEGYTNAEILEFLEGKNRKEETI